MRVRLYVPTAQEGKETALSKDQIRHLKVIRLREGEKIYLFDGKGHEFETVYSQKVRDGKITPERTVTPQTEPKTQITLAIAVPKGGRMDTLIEKVSELGVSRIVPIICKRSIVNPRETKVERWRKITIEACAQSERCTIPTIEDPKTYKELLGTIRNYDKTYICHKTGQQLTKTTHNKILIIIGPEGDFTEEELQEAEKQGCQKVRLAPTILRTETAGITAIAQIIGLNE